MNAFKSIKWNTSLQEVMGVRLRLIVRGDYHMKNARRYVINDTNQNIWIPCKHLSKDGTIREGENLSYLFLGRQRQLYIANSMKEDMNMKPPFQVIIAGGREFTDLVAMTDFVDRCLAGKRDTHDIVIISGTARGADKTGEAYAALRGYKLIRMPAEWERHGNSAGYRRNQDMADIADAVICFWDGKSRGTGHMVDIAKERELPLRIHYY